MINKYRDLLTFTGAVGILIASFLSFATTKSVTAYISITHMGVLFYLLPGLGLITLIFAILALTKKLDAKPASLALGVTLLGLSVFTGIQAQAQLEGFVSLQYEMQAKRDRFEADFKAQRDAFDKDFANFGSESPRTEAVKLPSPPEVKPIVIDDANLSTWGAGFYLSTVASLLILVSGVRARKTPT